MNWAMKVSSSSMNKYKLETPLCKYQPTSPTVGDVGFFVLKHNARVHNGRMCKNLLDIDPEYQHYIL